MTWWQKVWWWKENECIVASDIQFEGNELFLKIDTDADDDE